MAHYDIVNSNISLSLFDSDFVTFASTQIIIDIYCIDYNLRQIYQVD